MWNLLANNGIIENYTVYQIICIVLVFLMLVAAVAAIILVLMQPSNSDGIQAIQGSSETFFGKNKGKSIEEKLKKWTIVCLVVLAVLSVIFFILRSI
ncbi:MAG: preprotein translocase subunit SecG [Clostridia bacterium]|nr:preprotein translocase subunit SecG [Clostridia bacterium]